MRHLRFAHDPNYRAYCIRKNSSAIMSSGGLFWEAVKLYTQYDPKLKVKLKDQKVVFSSGAEVSFSHYENDTAAKKYQGIQISNIFYDEVTHADNEEQLWWLWSRLRSDSDNTHSMWWSCNPDNDSWVLKYAMWYLYPEGHEFAGRPDPEKNGIVRYLLRINGDLVWGDTAQELKDKYGEDKEPISFQGLFGTIDDNPPLLKSNKLYKSNLEALPRLERERLLHGNWFARSEASGYWKRSWCGEILKPYAQSEVLKSVRAYDLAGSVPSETNPDCDYSVGVRMDLLKNGNYVITDVVRWRSRYGEVERKILEVAESDGKKVDIVIPRDPGQAGLAAAQMLARTITGSGYYCRMKPTSKSKIERFRPFGSACENGLVEIVRNCADDLWNKTYNDNTWFYNEMEAFDGGRRGHDDSVDAVSEAFEYLATSKKIPIGFKLPSFTETNPFAFN